MSEFWRWVELKDVKVWSNGKEIIIEGDPPDEEADPGPEPVHHCDSMGCRWVHILYRSPITPEKAIEIGYVCPPEPKPERREPSLARLNAMALQRMAGNDVTDHFRFPDEEATWSMIARAKAAKGGQA